MDWSVQNSIVTVKHGSAINVSALSKIEESNATVTMLFWTGQSMKTGYKTGKPITQQEASAR